MNCPMCGREIVEPEILILKYIDKKGWWATYHLRPADVANQELLEVLGMRMVGGRAAIQKVVDV